jgi:hypothetical protein
MTADKNRSGSRPAAQGKSGKAGARAWHSRTALIKVTTLRLVLQAERVFWRRNHIISGSPVRVLYYCATENTGTL